MIKLFKSIALTSVTLSMGVGLIFAVYTAPFWVPDND